MRSSIICLWADNFCLQHAVKELLEADSICKSYAQMKKGPVFLTHSVLSMLPMYEPSTQKINFKAFQWQIPQTNIVSVCPIVLL